MLVIVMKDRLLLPAAVCQGCPMASQSGLPRWRQGRLRCGRPIEHPRGHLQHSLLDSHASEGCIDTSENKVPMQYECTMGFRIAHLSEQSA